MNKTKIIYTVRWAAHKRRPIHKVVVIGDTDFAFTDDIVRHGLHQSASLMAH